MIEIYYDNGQYIISADGDRLGRGETYHDAYAIETSYLEARNSAMMGGDPLLIEAERFAQVGDMQMPEGDWLDVNGMRVTAPWAADNTPLLADCAAIIRRCLGSTTGAGGIVEELRRVEARLAEQGW